MYKNYTKNSSPFTSHPVLLVDSLSINFISLKTMLVLLLLDCFISNFIYCVSIMQGGNLALPFPL